MQTLVIGGSGFLGTHIVEALLAASHRVSVLSRNPEAAARTLPAGVTVLQGDLGELEGPALVALLAPFDKLVYAAGADERTRPNIDARDFFFRENVDTCRKVLLAARATNITNTVVLNSIFTHVNRTHPGLALARHHPYIASRIAQSEMALEVAEGYYTQTVLEVPWVFGDSRGRPNQWAAMVHYARLSAPLLCPDGGTVAIAAENVGQATVGALARTPGAKNLSLPIGDSHISWDQLILRFAKFGGRKQPVITRLPARLFASMNALGAVSLQIIGAKSGLDFARMHEFLLEHISADLSASQKILGYTPRNIDGALQATVFSVPEPSLLRGWRKWVVNRSFVPAAIAAVLPATSQ